MRSLAVYDKMEVVNTNEIPDKYVTSVLFWDALRALLLTSALLLVGLIFALGTGFASRSAVSGVIGFFMALYTGGVLIAAFPKLFMLGSPLRRLKAFGNGILKALETQNLLEEPHCKVVFFFLEEADAIRPYSRSVSTIFSMRSITSATFW